MRWSSNDPPLKFNIEPKKLPFPKRKGWYPFATIFQGWAVSFTESKDLLGELQLLVVLFLHRCFGDIAEIPTFWDIPTKWIQVDDSKSAWEVCVGPTIVASADLGVIISTRFDHDIYIIYIYIHRFMNCQPLIVYLLVLGSPYSIYQFFCLTSMP